MINSSGGDKHRAYIFLSLATAIWGSLYVVTRIALETIPPITLLFFRYVIASVVLLGLCVNGRKSLRIEAKDRKSFLFIVILGYFIAVGSQVMGTKYAGAAVASLVNSMNPIFITLFAVILLKEKIIISKVVAGFASLTGVYIILGGASSVGTVWGVGFSLASVLLWSVTAIYVRKITRKYDPLVVTTYAIAIAAVCSFPIAGYEILLRPHAGLFSTVNILCVLYLGAICTAIPNLLWNKSLSLVEASTCSLFYPIQPLVFVLSERIDPKFEAGSLLIVGGIIYAVYMEKKIEIVMQEANT
jgi:drug/metabolite transporter (DMT)-like permease